MLASSPPLLFSERSDYILIWYFYFFRYFPLLIISMAHFSMSNSIPMSWLFILIACIRVSNSFSFLANDLMLSMSIRWSIFSCDLVSLYPPVHFLRMWLSGIITIRIISGDSPSRWKIPFWIFISTKLFPAAVNSNSSVFHCFHDKLYGFIWYLVHFETFYYPALRDNIVCLFVVNPRHNYIFSVSFCSPSSELTNV